MSQQDFNNQVAPSSRPNRQGDWLPVLTVLGIVGGGIGWFICSRPLPIAPPVVDGSTPEQSVAATNDTLNVVREPLVFTDIPADYWAKPYIDALTARDIVDGLPDGTYAPSRAMTRAELAVQVAQAFAIAPQYPAATFTDVPTDFWAANTIETAVTTGFMKGYPEQVFKPDATLTRLEALVTLVTGLGLAPTDSPATLLSVYPDQASIPDWAAPKIAAAIEAGLITPGSNGDLPLRPNDPATRAEVTVMLYRSLVNRGRIDPLP